MIVVADASPLIFLGKLGRLDLIGEVLGKITLCERFLNRLEKR